MIEKCLGRTAHESNRRREQWTWRDGLVIVSIVALGTVVAAVTNEDNGHVDSRLRVCGIAGSARAIQLRFCR